MNTLKDLEYLLGTDIFLDLDVFIDAYTTQSRLRREKSNIADFLNEIEDEFGGKENLQIKDYVRNNKLQIDMDLLTSTEVVYDGGSRQSIIDGWSRVDMILTFLLACLLYHRFKKWNADSVSMELENIFKLGDEIQWTYLEDSKKIELKRQVNYLLPLLVNGQRDITVVKTHSKDKRQHQINLFCIHIETCFNKIKNKWKISSPEKLQNLYHNVLGGLKFCSKFVYQDEDSSKSFYNKNIKSVNLTPECEDAVMIYNDREKFDFPKSIDDSLYGIIDDYIQELGYWIRETGIKPSKFDKYWYRYLCKSQISVDTNKAKREVDHTRKLFRKDVSNCLKEQYIIDGKKIVPTHMIAKLEELTYTTDFENIYKLVCMDFSTNIWPLCLKLMRNGLFDEKRQRYLYNLTRNSEFIGTGLWTNWDTDWLNPLLEDIDLLTKPIKTIHKHLVEHTFGQKNDIRDLYADRRVRKEVKAANRNSLVYIDTVQGNILGGQYDEIRVYADSMIKNQRKFVDSIEHIASQEAESDIKTECVDLGGNQYSAGRRDNSMWSNKDYTDKRKSYENMKSDLPPVLRLVQFGPVGMKIQKDYKNICKQFNGTFDIDTLEKWNVEVTKLNDDNRFYKFHRFMADKIFDLDYIRKYLNV